MTKVKIKIKKSKGYAERRDRLAAEGTEPTTAEVKKRMDRTGQSFYQAREDARNDAYGGPVPFGYSSWGDYWKGR